MFESLLESDWLRRSQFDFKENMFYCKEYREGAFPGGKISGGKGYREENEFTKCRQTPLATGSKAMQSGVS
jgi:hypothetical protein